MASACKSAVMAAGKRTFTARSHLISRSLGPKPIPTSPFSSSIPSTPRVPFRIASVLGSSVDSMLPLHSAIASARLKSNIATDSTCWSWLSQGFATPL